MKNKNSARAKSEKLASIYTLRFIHKTVKLNITRCKILVLLNLHVLVVMKFTGKFLIQEAMLQITISQFLMKKLKKEPFLTSDTSVFDDV